MPTATNDRPVGQKDGAPPAKRPLKFFLRPEYHRRLRIRAAETDTSASRLVQQVIEQFLDGLDAKTPDGGTSGEQIA